MKDKPAFTWKNWWDYNKWLVLGTLAALAALGQVLYSNLHQIKPDYQLAYSGTYPLDSESEAFLKTYFQSMGTDLNGDGEVVFEIHQYPSFDVADEQIAMGQEAGKTRLLADMVDNQSYFYLLENPQLFQLDYDILCDDWIPFSSLSADASSAGLQTLTLARREFEEGREADYMDGCADLWKKLQQEAVQ